MAKSDPLTREELLELTRPPHLAVLATVTPAGKPRTTPCWSEYDGETFNVSSITTQARCGTSARTPRYL